eukprot:gene35897-43542_t
MTVHRVLAFLFISCQIVWICHGGSVGSAKFPSNIVNSEDFIQKAKRHAQALFKQCLSESTNESVIDIYNALQKEKQEKTAQCQPTVGHHIAQKLLQIRGGKMIKGQKIKGFAEKTKEAYKQVPMINRYYLTLILLCTLVHMTGLPAPELFSLSIPNIMQIWRPLTSLAYFGPPSMSLAQSIYYLIRYGGMLEGLHGAGEYAFFLAVQSVLLTVLALGLGFPFAAQSMVTAIIYSCSRLNPMESIPFQFGFSITSWQLPFCMMAVDILSQSSAAAAWPHLLGILTGHIYHFFHDIYPKLGGKQLFATPSFFIKTFGDRPKGDKDAVTEDKTSEKEKKKEEMKKKMKKMKGRKLGV